MADIESHSASQREPKGGRKNIVFFHPDLGIGGAERLIIDAAVGLQDSGHKVTLFTSHCDPHHCFEEARDGTLDVRVRGNTIFPPTILNRFHILLATLRQIHLIFAVSISSDELRSLKPDVFIVDQLPSCVPLLRWLYPTKQRTLFYCHFPDQLLVQRNDSGVLRAVKDAYRLAFDWFEGWSMSASDRIVVNSHFTMSVVKKVFSGLTTDPAVVYPCVDAKESADQQHEVLWGDQYKIILSINRFERKKDIGLAIKAYQTLSLTERKSTRLVLAGGYDARVEENVSYHKELVDLVERLGMKQATAKTAPTALAVPTDTDVLFLLSVPGPFKDVLLRNAKLLLYTPTNEHFGIVPVEAMQYGVPVLASNTGGPLETIKQAETGWLKDVRDIDEWANIIRKVLLMTPDEARKMGENGKRRVRERFTRPIMAEALNYNIDGMLKAPRSRFVERKDVEMALIVVGMFAAALFSVWVKARTSKGSDRRASQFARLRREEV